MSFKVLTESQITANLIDTYTSLISTVDDMNKGSNIRSIFEAFAQELKRFYQSAQENALETQKTAAYTMFKFALLPAQAAYTIETFSIPVALSVDVSVPAGTTVSVKGTNIQFKTVSAQTWRKGQTIFQTTVVCNQVGSIGNRRANEINNLVTPIQGLNNVSCTNQRDVRSGRDLETNDQRENRFQQFVNSLHAGDIRALLYGAKTAQLTDQYGYIYEQVTKAQIVEGLGSNTIYVDNGYYNVPTALVQECQKMIDGYVDSSGNFMRGYKAAGVPSVVTKADYQRLNLAVSVTPRVGYTFSMIQQSVINAITVHFQSLDIGETLKKKDIDLAIGSTSGVLNFTHNLSADVTPVAGTLIQLGLGQPVISLA
jgi:uncharacterized phage protein gp47/JayE